ncbi:MAG: AAC(3) family N-acetyltransferase [Anaerolineales bacterium]|nr:AAC(3) family N-acetyltransferase [Anaerolineales bacterium]
MPIDVMDPETFVHQFRQDLIRLGVRPGGVLMVHPALRPFGHVPGGPETLIRGLRAVLGESGTLLMPALTYDTVTPRKPVFNLRTTPACIGAVAEAFRVHPGTRRSLHPTHSVCGLGSLAEALLTPHAEDSTPCGPNSPFHRLPEFAGQILMLACGLLYNTSMHAIEERVEPPYLFDPPIRYTLTGADGQTFEKEYTPHNFAGWRQRYDRVAEILDEPALRSAPVAGADSHLIEAGDLWPEALARLRGDPLFFIDRV